MNVANAVGRWLGVTASEEEVKERQYAYQRRKSGMDLLPQGIVLLQLTLLAHSIQVGHRAAVARRHRPPL